MVAGAGQQLLDLAVSHQIGLTRYSTAVASRVVALLDRTDAEIVTELRARQSAPAQVNATLSRLSALNKAAYRLVGQDLGEQLEDLSASEADYQDEAFQRILDHSVTTRSPTGAALRAAVYSQPFQGGLLREWVAGLETGRMTRLRQALRQSVALGESVDQLVVRIRGTAATGYRDGILDISRRSATTLARTAVAHVAAAARELYYAANEDIVGGVRWVSVLDSKTSAPCRTLDGQIFAIGKGPRPPHHLGCRSTTVAVLKSWEQMGLPPDISDELKLALSGEPPGRLTYSDWLVRQPASVQDDVLGVSKGRLFREGSYTLERFTDAAGKELTLAQLRARDSETFSRLGI